MKVPFYFRTRDELASFQTALLELNSEIRKQIGWSSAALVQFTTKYTEKNPIFNNIPKSKHGEKKYIGVLHANQEKMERLNIDLEEWVTKIDGLELVRRGDDGPKYAGETTKGKFVVKTESQFTSLISVLDTAFGHGNWRIKGPQRNVRQLIKRVEEAQSRTDNPFLMNYVRQYKNGVPLGITVNQPNADLNKYLFKVKLKA